MDLSVDKLESMKYVELQKLAKKLGVKANMKVGTLRLQHTVTVTDSDTGTAQLQNTYNTVHRL